MYVCLYVLTSSGEGSFHFGLSRFPTAPPRGQASTQPGAIIPLPPVCPTTTRGILRDTYPRTGPAKSPQEAGISDSFTVTQGG